MNLPIQIQDLDKIPVVTSDIREMLMSYPKIFLENEKPRCHVSQVGPSSLNIAITCNLRPMVWHFVPGFSCQRSPLLLMELFAFLAAVCHECQTTFI